MRRFTATTIALGVAALVLFVVGWLLAPSVIEAVGALLAVRRVHVASPSDFLVVQLSIGATFAVAPVIGWIAVVIRRRRSGADAPLGAVLLYVAVPLVSVAVGMMLRAFALRSAMAELVATFPDANVRPLFMFEDLSPHGWGLSAGLLSGLVLWTMVALRAPRRRT